MRGHTSAHLPALPSDPWHPPEVGGRAEDSASFIPPLSGCGVTTWACTAVLTAVSGPGSTSRGESEALAPPCRWGGGRSWDSSPLPCPPGCLSPGGGAWPVSAPSKQETGRRPPSRHCVRRGGSRPFPHRKPGGGRREGWLGCRGAASCGSGLRGGRGGSPEPRGPLPTQSPGRRPGKSSYPFPWTPRPRPGVFPATGQAMGWPAASGVI